MFASPMSMLPLSETEAEAVAEAEGLSLVRSGWSSTGFKGVTRVSDSVSTPYRFRVQANGGGVYLGTFRSAAEGALAFARYLGPEGCQRGRPSLVFRTQAPWA